MSEAILKAVAEAIASIEVKLSQHIKDVESRLSALSDKADVTQLSEFVTETRDEFEQIKFNLATDFAGITGSMMLDHRKAIDYTDTKFSEFDARKSVAEAKEQLDANLLAFESLFNKSLEEFSARLDEIGSPQDSINATTVLITLSIDSVRKDLSSLANSIDVRLDESVSSIKSQTNLLTDVVDDLHEENKTLRSELEALKSVSGYIGRDGLGVNTKSWEPGIYREGSTVQHFIGQLWTAKCDTNAEPGVNDDWTREGSFGYRHRGNHDENTKYAIGDMYIKDFGTFLVADHDRHVILAARGPRGKGEKGDKGADSTVAGPAGVSIKGVITDDEGFVLEMSDGGLHVIKYPDDIVSLSKIKSLVGGASDFESFKSAMLSL